MSKFKNINYQSGIDSLDSGGTDFGQIIYY